jgi:hypothetical protein
VRRDRRHRGGDRRLPGTRQPSGETVLVELRFPRELPSSSLSEGAVYVSRVKPPGRPARWLLWAVEH